MRFSKSIAIGCLLATASAVVGGLGTPIAKALLTDGIVTPSGLTLLRIAGTAIVFWTLPAGRQKVQPKHLCIMLPIGAIGIAAQLATFNYALNLSFPIEVSIISSCSALWLVVLGIISRQIKETRYLTRGSMLTIVGLLITIFFFGEEKHNFSHISGNWIAFGSMLMGGLCSAGVAKLTPYYHAATIYKWIYTFATVPIIIYFLLAGQVPTLKIHSAISVIEIIYVCIVTGDAGILLHAKAQQQISNKTIDICSFAQPFTAIVVAYNIGFNTLTWFDPISIILIFISYLIATKGKI